MIFMKIRKNKFYSYSFNAVNLRLVGNFSTLCNCRYHSCCFCLLYYTIRLYTYLHKYCVRWRQCFTFFYLIWTDYISRTFIIIKYNTFGDRNLIPMNLHLCFFLLYYYFVDNNFSIWFKILHRKLLSVIIMKVC